MTRIGLVDVEARLAARHRLRVQLRHAQNLAAVQLVAASLPRDLLRQGHGAPDKHEAATPARATASTTHGPVGVRGGCCLNGRA